MFTQSFLPKTRDTESRSRCSLSVVTHICSWAAAEKYSDAGTEDLGVLTTNETLLMKMTTLLSSTIGKQPLRLTCRMRQVLRLHYIFSVIVIELVLYHKSSTA